MDTPGAFYAITLHTPELRQTLTGERARRNGPSAAIRLATGIRHGLAHTVRALAAHVDAPRREAETASPESVLPAAVSYAGPAAVR